MEILEYLLYQTKITYEHQMFIISFLTNKEQNLKDILKEDISKYQKLLKELLVVSNKGVSKRFINSNLLITPYTKNLELITNKYFDIGIDINITNLCLSLSPGENYLNEKDIINYSKKLLNLLNNTQSILNNINKMQIKKELFLTIYNITIPHIIEENNILKEILERIISNELPDPTFLYSLEYYYVKFLQEHAFLIKQILDTKEENISKEILNKYNNLLNKFNNDISPYTINQIHIDCKNITKEFINTIEQINKEIQTNQKEIIIIPLIMDHFLRENNSFILTLDYCNR